MARTQPDAAATEPQNNVNIAGDHNTAQVGSNNTIININVAPGAVLPSGSEAERAYLREHAQTILRSILAAADSPEADILSRFVRDTWCSDEHEQLNNVLAVKNSAHRYVILRMEDGKPQLDTIAGKDAPEQLVKIAQKVMHQFAIDACAGHDPSRLNDKWFDRTLDTREEAEAHQQNSGGGGQVVQMDTLGRGGDHQGKPGHYWMVVRGYNDPPIVKPPMYEEGKTVAWVDRRLKVKKDRERVKAVVSAQLWLVDNRFTKKQKMRAALAARASAAPVSPS